MNRFWFIVYLVLFAIGFLIIWIPGIFNLASGDLPTKMIITLILALAVVLQRFWKE